MTIHKIQPLLSLYTYALTFTHTLLNSTYYWLQSIPWYDYTICCSYLVAQPCLILCNPMDCSTPGFPVLHHLPKFAQTHVIELVMLYNHLICRPLLLTIP